MMANHNNQVIRDIHQAFFYVVVVFFFFSFFLIYCILYQDIDINNDQAAKKRKREKNLMNWKWSEVIVVDDLPDIVEPANVANVPNTATI